MSELDEQAPELRVRTVPGADGVLWVSAALLWADGELTEIARVRRDLLAPGDEGGGDPLFHGWLDAVGAIFRRRLDDVTGTEHILKRVGRGRRHPGQAVEPDDVAGEPEDG